LGWVCSDEFSLRYSDLVTGSYDCVDRIVLNAFFPLGWFAFTKADRRVTCYYF
jgi:hypothetical protein